MFEVQTGAPEGGEGWKTTTHPPATTLLVLTFLSKTTSPPQRRWEGTEGWSFGSPPTIETIGFKLEWFHVWPHLHISKWCSVLKQTSTLMLLRQKGGSALCSEAAHATRTAEEKKKTNNQTSTSTLRNHKILLFPSSFYDQVSVSGALHNTPL